MAKATQAIRYNVIGKATVERGGDHISHAIKLLYKGDGTPWWTCSAGLDLPVSSEIFAAVKPGDEVMITIQHGDD